jgi:hypothetical protein
MNGKIYKLIDLTTNSIYIGSTLSDLRLRLSQHKSNYKRYLRNNKFYLTAFEILKNNNYTITLLEEVNVNSREELFKKEREYIERLECVNNNTPSRTRDEKLEYDRLYFKEYYKNNKADHLYKCKLYNEINKERLKEYQKQYRMKNKI